MHVRDYTLSQTDYKGRWTEASDWQCPCRPCYNAHDCGRPVPVYDKNGRWVGNRYVLDMQCATRYNRGCPSPKPEPTHQFGRKVGSLCYRCRGAVRKTIAEETPEEARIRKQLSSVVSTLKKNFKVHNYTVAKAHIDDSGNLHYMTRTLYAYDLTSEEYMGLSAYLNILSSEVHSAYRDNSRISVEEAVFAVTLRVYPPQNWEVLIEYNPSYDMKGFPNNVVTAVRKHYAAKTNSQIE